MVVVKVGKSLPGRDTLLGWYVTIQLKAVDLSLLIKIRGKERGEMCVGKETINELGVGGREERQ